MVQQDIMKILALTTLAILSLIVATANAECEFCSDSRIACTGDTEREVLDKCGPPAKTVYYENIFHEIVRIDHYYDLGKDRFIRVFTFRKGRLSGISTIK